MSVSRTMYLVGYKFVKYGCTLYLCAENWYNKIIYYMINV